MTALAQVRRKTSKPAYKPFVRIADRKLGLYTVQSESYGGYLLYLVDALGGRCECEGYVTWGKTCKHIKAAQLCHRAFSPKPEPEPALPVMTIDLRGGAAGLLEAFGA